MAFVLTALYVALSLLSPAVLPEAIWSLHVNIILGVAVILVLLPQIGSAKLGAIPDSAFVAGLLLACGLSTLHLGFSAAAATLMDSLPSFIVFYFVVISCNSLSKLRVLVYVLVAIAMFIFSQGWMADHAHLEKSPYFMLEGTIVRYQGLGVLSDPNDLAQLYVTVIPLLFLRWKKGAPAQNLFFTLVPAALLATGMYFTHSRGGAIALLAVFLFGFKEKLGFALSSILAAGLFVGMMALNVSGGRGMDNDDGGRVAAWSTGLQLFKAHPIVGVGMNQFVEFNETGHTAHNSYILALAETGLLGYFCWMGTIVANYSGLSQIVRSKKDRAGQLNQEADSGPLPPHLRYRTGMASVRGVPGTFSLKTATAGGGFAAPAYGTAVPATWAPASVRFGRSNPQGSSVEDGDLIHAAKVLRISFVGLLTSAFFLSRSFSMVFYVLLGMSATVRILFLTKHPDQVPDRRLMMKRILIVVAGSVVFLYLFVRVRGVHG